VINMKNKRVSILGISSIIVLIASILTFALLKPENCNSSVGLGFGFLIFTELVLFGGAIGIEFISGSQIINRVGCGMSVLVYSLISMVLSIIFIIMNTDFIKWFWIVEILMTAVTVILFISFATVARSVLDKDRNLLNSVNTVSTMIDRLAALKENQRYGKQIGKLAEDLRYTDISSTVAVDEDIELLISKIEMELVNDEYADSVSEYIGKLFVLIKRRKLQVKDKKVGGV
jgi:hypothetical protein